MTTKTIDSKGRLALGNRFAGRLVLIDDSDPDKLVVMPARAIPESEAWLYENEKALGRVRSGLAQARRRRFSEAPPDVDGDASLAAKLAD